MKMRRLLCVLLITTLCFLTADRRIAYCAEVYQTESGVNETAWGTSCDDHIRQMMIKYHLNQNITLSDLSSVDAAESLQRYIKVLFYIVRIFS